MISVSYDNISLDNLIYLKVIKNFLFLNIAIITKSAASLAYVVSITAKLSIISKKQG